MKLQLCLFIFTAFFTIEGFAQDQLILTHSIVRTQENSSVVELEFENTFDQPIKAIRVMVVLLNESGKAVGNQSQWLGNSQSKGLNFEPKESETFLTRAQTNEKAVNVNVFVTRIILDDGSKPNLKRSFSRKTN